MPDLGFKVNGNDIGSKYVTKEYAMDRYGWLFVDKQPVMYLNGDNFDGILGDNTTTDKNTFVNIAGFTPFIQVTGNDLSTIGSKNDGTLWSWGKDNSYGLLGQGTTTSSRSSPVQIMVGRFMADISTGLSHHSVIDSEGIIWSWGDNSYGQLGDSTTTIRTSPVKLTTTSSFDTKTWKKIDSCYNATGAIDASGALYMWGLNSGGLLGTGDGVNRSIPTQVVGGGTWTHFSTSGSVSAGIRSDGSVWAWGTNAGRSATDVLATGTTDSNITSPRQVLGLSGNWKQLSTAATNVVVLDYSGLLWAWGVNETTGSLGTGSSGVHTSPLTVIGGQGWAKIAGTRDRSTTFFHGIKKDGTLWAWGTNTSATYAPLLGLSDSSTAVFSSPTQVGTDKNWKSVYSRFTGASALKEGQDW